jgi:hypothetical protein
MEKPSGLPVKDFLPKKFPSISKYLIARTNKKVMNKMLRN